ncbi:hypothetical protein BG015_011099 [Linnemannia schmuckeri]|uniref:Uncharacterized protein n=1 Tax=Linnemannia schmuckeri TaxID=64567 RepID=A0A9P5V8E7_9FUNG|nr:hypothetical protein BG015_011099 [Linnemannia schmuckeri]
MSNLIGDDGAVALSEALKASLALTTLDLESNWIGPNGTETLSEVLKINSTPTTLDLMSCNKMRADERKRRSSNCVAVLPVSGNLDEILEQPLFQY